MLYDVVIIGAGTAGLYLAYKLGKAGFSVLVVEQKPLDKLYKITGDAIGKAHLERHGIVLPAKAIDNVYTGAKIYSPEEDIVITLPGEGYSLNMYEWARFLVNQAVNAGVSIQDRTSAVKPIVEGVQVRGVVVQTPSGKSELHAKLIVDASGATAVIRTRLPREWPISEPLLPEDVSYAYREIIEVDYDIADSEYIRIYLNQEVSPGGYWWFFPKSKRLANVGLGIWGKLVRDRKLNPTEYFRRFLEKRPELRGRKVINAGGGIVPTRRPLLTMVWNNFLAVGDAAVTVNPLHGGGLGPALLSADLAAKVVCEAFERGDLSASSLWEYNKLYLKHYGIKQAKLDIMRLALQHMSNEEIEQGLRARLMDSAEILALSAEGREPSLVDKLKLLVKTLRLPLSLIRKLLLAKTYMRRVEELYKSYPDDPSGLETWTAQLRALYDEYLSKLARLVR